jgi:hypothetical protein
MYPAPGPAFFSTLEIASSICSVMFSPAGDANSPEPPAEQKMHPQVPFVPSRLGHVFAKLIDALYILQPNTDL